MNLSAYVKSYYKKKRQQIISIDETNFITSLESLIDAVEGDNKNFSTMLRHIETVFDKVFLPATTQQQKLLAIEQFQTATLPYQQWQTWLLAVVITGICVILGAIIGAAISAAISHGTLTIPGALAEASVGAKVGMSVGGSLGLGSSYFGIFRVKPSINQSIHSIVERGRDLAKPNAVAAPPMVAVQA